MGRPPFIAWQGRPLIPWLLVFLVALMAMSPFMLTEMSLSGHAWLGRQQSCMGFCGVSLRQGRRSQVKFMLASLSFLMETTFMSSASRKPILTRLACCCLQMEDRAVCFETLQGVHASSLGLYGVYDGHNGHAIADFVSGNLHGGVASALQKWWDACLPASSYTIRACCLSLI